VSGAVAVFPKGSSAVVALGVTSKLGTKSQRDFDGYNDTRHSRVKQTRRRLGSCVVTRTLTSRETTHNQQHAPRNPHSLTNTAPIWNRFTK